MLYMNVMLRIIVEHLLLVLFLTCTQSKDLIPLSTKQGKLLGDTLASPRTNKTFYAFMGIPYAKPPLGDLRFKAPQAAEGWSGERNASYERDVCTQIPIFTTEVIGSEDCLFLNVFTPRVSQDNLKSVMVFIHGGAWQFGSGNLEYVGPHYLVDEDVVMVTLNYRLNALGFLSLHTKEVPGNAGLKDQVMALRWIQENIEQFGGNPHSVTIVGESCGGTSVQYHMLSPMSKGLFHRAISESGSALNTWAFHKPDKNFGFKFGASLGINTTNKHVLTRKLKALSAKQLTEASQFFLHYDSALVYDFSISPTVDEMSQNGESFLPDSPSNLLKIGKCKRVPYLTGFNSNEGICFTRGIKKIINKDVQENIQSLYPEYFGLERKDEIFYSIADSVKDFYFFQNMDFNQKLLQYTNFTSDIHFVNGIYCTAVNLSTESDYPLYMYQFSFDGYMNTMKDAFGGSDIPGVAHLDEIPYLYWKRKQFLPNTPEVTTSNRMVKMWTNFAKEGNPTPHPDPLLQNVIWKPFSSTSPAYLNIDTKLFVEYAPKKANMEFWRKIFNEHSYLPC